MVSQSLKMGAKRKVGAVFNSLVYQAGNMDQRKMDFHNYRQHKKQYS